MKIKSASGGREGNTGASRVLLHILMVIGLFLGICFPPSVAQAADKECQALMKEVDETVDKAAEVSERIGTVEQRIDASGANPTRQHTLETDKSTLRKTKLKVANLVEKVCACYAKKIEGTAAGRPRKECESLMKQIDDLVDKVAEVSQRIGIVQERVDASGTNPTRQHTLETDKSTLRQTKLKIAKLVEKLCECCGQRPSAAQQPTPSTTDKVTDVLKTIGSHVSIGIGGGGSTGGRDHHDRVKGEDRTRTAEKVKTNDKSKTTSKPKTTSGRTVTAGCKCHPCTCSPCMCH